MERWKFFRNAVALILAISLTVLAFQADTVKATKRAILKSSHLSSKSDSILVTRGDTLKNRTVAEIALDMGAVIGVPDSARAAHVSDTTLHEKDSVRTCYKADTSIKSQRAVFADSSTNTHKADTAIKAQRSIFSDSSTNCHKADTSIKSQRSVFSDSATNAHKADTAIKAQRCVFADSSTNTHKADTAIKSQRSVFSDSAFAANHSLKLTVARTIGGVSFDGTANIVPDTSKGAKYWSGLEMPSVGYGADGWLRYHSGLSWATPTYSDVGALAAGGTAVDADKLDGQHGSHYAPAAHGVTQYYIPYAATTTTFGTSPIYTDGSSISLGGTYLGKILNIKSDNPIFLNSSTNNGGIVGVDFGHSGIYNFQKSAILNQFSGAYGQGDFYFVMNTVNDGNTYNIANDTKVLFAKEGRIEIKNSDVATLELNSATNGGGVNAIEFTHSGIYGFPKSAIFTKVNSIGYSSSDIYFAANGIADGNAYTISDVKMTIKASGNIDSKANWHDTGDHWVQGNVTSRSVSADTVLANDFLWCKGQANFDGIFNLMSPLKIETDSYWGSGSKFDIHSSNFVCQSFSFPNSGGVPRSDSLWMIGMIDNKSFKISLTRGATTITPIEFDTNNNVKINKLIIGGTSDTLSTYRKFTFYDSIFDGATYRTRGLATMVVVGRQVTLYQPQLLGTITSSTDTYIKGIPMAYLPMTGATSALTDMPAPIATPPGYRHLGLFEADNSGNIKIFKEDATQLDAGSNGGIMACCLSWVY